MSVIKKLSPRFWKKDSLSRLSPLPHNRSAPADAEEEVLDFFRESPSGPSLLNELDGRDHSPHSTRTHFAQVARSAVSVFTKDSVLEHLKQLPRAIPLPALCDLINQHLSLQHAEIRSAEVYSQIGRVKHRFIILELFRVDKAPIWVRLDRHRQGSLASIILRLGRDLARDEAMLSADKRSLVGSAKLENRDLFMTNSTLGEFSLFIGVISRELVVYTIWPENCYFFCSLIQQHLDAEGEGEYVQGTLPYPELAANVRRRVQEGVRLVYHIPSPFSFAALFETVVSQKEWPDVDELATRLTNLTDPSVSSFQERSRNVARCSRLSAQLATHLTASGRDDDAILVLKTVYESFRALRNWSLLASTESSISSRPDIAHFLHSFHSLLLSFNHHSLALIASAEAIALERDLYDVDALAWRQDLAASLRTHCICLRDAGRYEQACVASSEHVMLVRMMYLHNKVKHAQYMAGALQLHGLVLREAGRFSEACDASAEDVALVRGLRVSGIDPEEHQRLFTSLRYHIIALQAAERYDDACDAGTESVTIMRSLYEKDPETSRDVFSSTLHQHSISLREAGRYGEACEVAAEGVALRRLLYANNANKHREPLFASLDEHSRSLRAAKNEREAHVASVEAVALKRLLYASNKAAHRSSFLKSLTSDNTLLQDSELLNEAIIAATEEVRLDRMTLSQDHATLFSPSSPELLRQCDQILSNSSLSQTVDDAKILALYRELCARDPSRYGDPFRSQLTGHFRKLRARNLVESCQVGADEVSFWRTLCQSSAEKYQTHLQLALHYSAIAFHDAGRFNEACDAGAEYVSLKRVLYEGDSERWRADLSSSLHQYGISLRDAGRFSEACDTGAEDVALMRMLYKANPEVWRRGYAVSLNQYGNSLQLAGRSSEACDAGLEAVMLSRQYLESDPKDSQKQTDYCDILWACSLSLRCDDRIEEAMELEEELAAVQRLINQRQDRAEHIVWRPTFAGLW